MLKSPRWGDTWSCVQDNSISSIASVISCALLRRSHENTNSQLEAATRLYYPTSIRPLSLSSKEKKA